MGHNIDNNTTMDNRGIYDMSINVPSNIGNLPPTPTSDASQPSGGTINSQGAGSAFGCRGGIAASRGTTKCI